VDFNLSLTGFDPREINAFTFTPDAAEDEVPLDVAYVRHATSHLVEVAVGLDRIGSGAPADHLE
jgi:hypothetical protein